MGKLKKKVGVLLCKNISVKTQLRSVSTLNTSNIPNKSFKMKGRFFTNHTMTGKVLDAITMKKNRCFGKETPSNKKGKRLNKSTNM